MAKRKDEEEQIGDDTVAPSDSVGVSKKRARDNKIRTGLSKAKAGLKRAGAKMAKNTSIEETPAEAEEEYELPAPVAPPDTGEEPELPAAAPRTIGRGGDEEQPATDTSQDL